MDLVTPHNNVYIAHLLYFNTKLVYREPFRHFKQQHLIITYINNHSTASNCFFLPFLIDYVFILRDTLRAHIKERCKGNIHQWESSFNISLSGIGYSSGAVAVGSALR